MTEIFRKSIVDSYNPDNEDLAFAVQVNDAITKHFSELRPSKSVNDPGRLGPISVFYAKLRAELLEKSGGYEVEGKPEFNKLSTVEQRHFQMASKLHNVHEWVWNLEIMPPVVSAIHQIDQDAIALKQLRIKIDTAKLRKNIEDVDADQLITLLMPALLNPPSQKIQAVISALLLATGRRTTEILKTAVLSLAPHMTSEGYQCVFSGQLKEGLLETQPYEIPLLAPYAYVKDALDFVRKTIDTTKMSTIAVNQKCAKPLSLYLNKLELALNPHKLRAVYALTTYEDLPAQRPTVIGWVSKVLGHAQNSNAIYYTRMKIVNYKGRYVPPSDAEWVVTCVAERKRLDSVEEMMSLRKRITASSVRGFGGGSMPVITRVIEANIERIERYNASL